MEEAQLNPLLRHRGPSVMESSFSLSSGVQCLCGLERELLGFQITSACPVRRHLLCASASHKSLTEMLPAIVGIVLVVPPTIVGRKNEASSSSVNSLLRSALFRHDMVPSPLRPWCRTLLSDAASRSTALVRYQACGASGRFLVWLLWVRSGVLCPQTQCEEVAARTGPRLLPVSAVEVGAPVPDLWAPAPPSEVVISHTDSP